MTERRSLLDDDATPTRERENVFDDQFEVDDEFEFDGVADGFRLNVDREEEGVHNDARQAARQDDDTIEPVVRSVSAHYATHPIPPSRSRNSMRKSRTYANPFSSPEDSAETEGEPRMEFEPDQNAIRRSASSTSSRMYAQTGSPQFGAGPSHPYGMYQQGTVARTASVATTSTIRPGLRQSFSQNGPQHPYAMYPQGVGEDDLIDEDEPLHHNPVPVGFPGIGQNYTRRMGPDGEDQDIIGEDGHTEQLPPYSRYPEEGPEKMPLLPTALHSRAPVHGTDPGMALMHTSLLPIQTPAPPQSMSDESTLVDNERRGSGSHLRLIATNGSESGSSSNEKKSWSEKSWKERTKTRIPIVGIPMWWLWLALGVLIFIGAVLGGVIGGFVAGSAKSDDDGVVLTSLWDASPVASPTSSMIPTGTFALDLGPPEETQCDCLAVDAQKPAWDCNLAPNSELAIVVGQGPGGSIGANVQYASNDMGIGYGSQLNMMNTSMASFLTVLDKDDLNNGVAFYFQQYYDKIVVLPNGAITPSKNKRNGKREGTWHPGFHVPDAWRQRRQMAAPGEQPWFCIWNSTFLEGFIYVTQPKSSTSSSAPATMSTNSTPPALPSIPPTTAASVVPTPTPTEYITTTYVATFPTTTVTFVATITPGDAPPWASAAWTDKENDEYNSHFTADHKAKREPLLSAVSAGSSTPASASETPDYFDSLPEFPYVLKLEERRTQMPNSIEPYCQLYQILNDGTANWVGDRDNDGKPIIVNLNENDMSFSAYQSAEANSDKARRKRGAVPGACHCQWMSGE